MNGDRAIAPGSPPGAMVLPEREGAGRGAGDAPVSAGRRRFGAALVAATLLLIFAGAEVKSRQAGLSVPDWPLSYGMVWPPMVGNIFYEHGHRTIATGVGLLTVILGAWTLAAERRTWVRRLAVLAIVAVIVQGVLGGLTVKLLLPPPVSIAHGLLAQTFLLLVTLLAFATSREWTEAPARAPVASPAAARAQKAAVAAVIAVYVQLGFGLLVRHTESGLAIPFFPVSGEGALAPDVVTWHVVLQLLHRGFALVVLTAVMVAAVRVARAVPELSTHARLAAALVCVQILLGASVIWTAGTDPANGITPIVAPVPTSLHVVTGAGLLATTFLLALRCGRRRAATAAAAPTAARTA